MNIETNDRTFSVGGGTSSVVASVDAATIAAMASAVVVVAASMVAFAVICPLLFGDKEEKAIEEALIVCVSTPFCIPVDSIVPTDASLLPNSPLRTIGCDGGRITSEGATGDRGLAWEEAVGADMTAAGAERSVL